jgi:hypothetical protein
VTAGFTGTQTLLAVLGTSAGLEIVETQHRKKSGGLQRPVFEPAGLENILTAPELEKRIEGGLGHIGGILGAERLGQHVLDANRFHDCANRLATDQSGTGTGRAEENLGSTERCKHIVGDGSSLQSHIYEAGAGVFSTLADGIAHFTALAETESNATQLVTSDNQRAEAETTTALHDFGRTVDENRFLGEFVTLSVIVVVGTTAGTTGTAVSTTITTAFGTLIPGSLGRGSGGGHLFFFVSHNRYLDES